MRYLYILIASIIVFSCSVQKRCERLDCKQQIIVEKTIIERDTVTLILYKDSIVTLMLPGFTDTVFIEKTIKVPKYIKVNVDTITKEVGLVGVKTWINDNILGSKGYLTDSAIIYTLDSLLTYKELLIKEKQSVLSVSNNKYTPKYYKVIHIAFWLLILIIIIYFQRKKINFLLKKF